jgi:hypothetical protein
MCAPLFAPQKVEAAFELPMNWNPQALILLGYTARLPSTPSRRPLDEVARYL